MLIRRFRRRQPRTARLAFLGLCIAFLGFTPGIANAAEQHSSTSAALPSLSNLIAQTKKAMLRAGTVRYAVVVSNASNKYSIVANLGPNTGTEDFLSGTAYGHVRLSRSDAYFSGNSTGLSDFFGMPAADIPRVGSKWVDIKAGTSQYATLKTSTTLPSVATSLFPTTKSATVTAASYKGTKSYVISWSLTANGTTSEQALYIPTQGSRLPLVAIGKTKIATQTITFSKWHEAIAILKPTATIPFSKVN